MAYPDRPVPKGFDRDEVERLLATTEGSTPVDFRDRAVRTILATCGLSRAGEVGALCVEHIDWERDMLRVFRPKTGRTDTFPLTPLRRQRVDGLSSQGAPGCGIGAGLVPDATGSVQAADEQRHRDDRPQPREPPWHHRYGHVAVEEVEREHIAELHYKLRDMPYQANRVLEIGNKLFNLAELWKLRTGSNPCKFVRKYREKKRERFLTDEEFRRLGDVLTEMEAEKTVPLYPAAALRLLMLTGCRRNEIVMLRWEHVDIDEGEIRLPDSKTGARMVPLSPAAARVLAEPSAHRGQPLGHSRIQAEQASVRSQPLLGSGARPGGPSGCANP